LGTLASSVARDFNDVLAHIGQAAQRARAQAPPGTDIAHSVETVVQAAVRGQALVDRLVASSQGGAHTRVVFELEKLVTEVMDKLAPTLPRSIAVSLQLQAPQALLRGDPSQAREAVINLCHNALQAMPAGGRLSVGLQRVHVAATRVLSHSLAMPGRYLALSVGDEGSGISAPVMEHLFEPFFTTRGEQGAPGLGLAMVHGFVSDMDGAVDVNNAKPGACFTLYLPEWGERADQP
jgi:signal transduction histidine kinase